MLVAAGVVTPVSVTPVEAADVLVPVAVAGVEMLVRGVKLMGMFRPLGAMAAPKVRVILEVACKTRTSTMTSDLGLSRSWMIFSARAIRSACRGR